MKIESTESFIKIFKKRFSHREKIQKKFDERIKKFVENPYNPVLSNHALTGKLKGYRAFSITGDIKVVYYAYNNTAYLVDIGTHNQVYN